MALDYTVVYENQVIDDDEDYPYGKARNRSSPGATDGTPLEQAWVNDLWGLLQAILGADGATPSGDPDTGASSQYFTALRRLQDGHVFSALDGSQIIISSGGQLRVLAGGTQELSGELDVEDGGTIEVQEGGLVNVNNGAEVNLNSGAILDALDGSNINLQSGSQLRVYSGGYVQLDGTFTAEDGSETTFADGSTLTLEGATNYPQLSSRSEWLQCPGQASFAYPEYWQDSLGEGWQCIVNTAQYAYWRIQVSTHYTMTKVTVLWRGSVHSTWPPENRTVFSVFKVALNGARTLLKEVADTNEQVTYEAVHELLIEDWDGDYAVFAPSEYLLIEMKTESGTNATAGSKWISNTMLATFTELRNQ